MCGTFPHLVLLTASVRRRISTSAASQSSSQFRVISSPTTTADWDEYAGRRPGPVCCNGGCAAARSAKPLSFGVSGMSAAQVAAAGIGVPLVTAHFACAVVQYCCRPPLGPAVWASACSVRTVHPQALTSEATLSGEDCGGRGEEGCNRDGLPGVTFSLLSKELSLPGELRVAGGPATAPLPLEAAAGASSGKDGVHPPHATSREMSPPSSATSGLMVPVTASVACCPKQGSASTAGQLLLF